MVFASRLFSCSGEIAEDTLKRWQCGTFFFFTVHVSGVDFFFFPSFLNETLSYNGFIPISLQHHKQCLVW